MLEWISKAGLYFLVIELIAVSTTAERIFSRHRSTHFLDYKFMKEACRTFRYPYQRFFLPNSLVVAIELVITN